MKAEMIPHTREWFRALKRHNPTQAGHTRQVLQMAGSEDVCSVCGDVPLGDYIVGTDPEWSMRLCEVCRHLHSLVGLRLRNIWTEERVEAVG